MEDANVEGLYICSVRPRRRCRYLNALPPIYLLQILLTLPGLASSSIQAPEIKTRSMALTRLILIQHAEAVEEEVDVTRPISDKGREDARKMAKYMAGSNLKFTPDGARVDTLLHSGKLRSEQTAEIFEANIFHHNEKLRVQKMSGMGPNDDVAGFWDSVKDGQLGAKIALCGHLPFLNMLSGHVLCDDSKLCPIALSNCGPACLERDEKTGKWQLKWLLPLTALPEFFEP